MPLSDQDLVIECKAEAATSLFESINDVAETLKRVPLSVLPAQEISKSWQYNIFTDKKNAFTFAEFYALAFDETCETGDTRRLTDFMRLLIRG
jgi:hypothetical protein